MDCFQSSGVLSQTKELPWKSCEKVQGYTYCQTYYFVLWQSHQSFLSMSDYEESNLYFIHDVICGIQELQLAIKKFMETKFSSGVERQETTTCFCYENKNDFSIFDSTTDEHLGETTAGIRFFCEEFAKYKPTLKVIYEYLFEDGMFIVAINEAQRYRLFDLEYVFTKLIAPLEFTTRGINCGPALVAQMKHTMILRPHERDALKVLFMSNKSKGKGKCQPQDKNPETEFNNASKNAFKLGTVQTILSRSATIQEKHESHKNLQIEQGTKWKAYKNKANKSSIPTELSGFALVGEKHLKSSACIVLIIHRMPTNMKFVALLMQLSKLIKI